MSNRNPGLVSDLLFVGATRRPCVGASPCGAALQHGFHHRAGVQYLRPGRSSYIVENCGNTLILRCSASEVGNRPVCLATHRRARSDAHYGFQKPKAVELLGSVTHSEHLSVESAVLPSQVEQLPDLTAI